jgi:hypothetical protein
VGWDGILVVVDPCSTEPAAYDRWFRRIEPLGAFRVERLGALVKQVRLYRCEAQTQPFPFDGRVPESARDSAALQLAEDGASPGRAVRR